MGGYQRQLLRFQTILQALALVVGGEGGAPRAVQIADRWHLLKNIREAGERVLSRPKVQRANKGKAGVNIGCISVGFSALEIVQKKGKGTDEGKVPLPQAQLRSESGFR